MPHSYLLSVIIPCYNCESYIYECMSSVCSQVDDSVEIIVINDGSTDDSPGQIESFISKHQTKNIRLISQHNQGVSAARNVGIAAASGVYLAFLDGDDLWDKSFWNKIRPLLESRETDLIEFNARRFYCDDKNNVTPVSIVSADENITVKTVCDLRETFLKSEWFPWARVYKKSLFDGMRFPVARQYEDIALIPKICLASKKTQRITDNLVLYRVRRGSITNTPTPKDIDDMVYALGVFRQLLTTGGKEEINTIAPAVRLTYSLARRISCGVHGYCYFNRQQIREIKFATAPFKRTEKLSKRIKFAFMREYCLIKKAKYAIRAYFARAE